MSQVAEDLAGDSPVVWLHDIREGDTIRYRMGRQGGVLVAEWPNVARLTCRPDGTGARLMPSAGSSVRPMAKLRGVVSVLLGDLRGGLGIHASAVALGSRAVVFLGSGDAGKSTAAAELCARHRARLLADDAALLEERAGVIRVAPTESRHYLTPASGRALGIRVRGTRLGPRGKAAILPARTANRSARIALVVSLRFDDSLDGPVCRPLRGSAAALRVVGSLFRFDLGDRHRELDLVTRLYDQGRFVEIARPRQRPSIVRLVLEALEGDHGR
ncbi:MAG: hypothetical protein ACRELB_21105 [Polyangiaceae bacterium]